MYSLSHLELKFSKLIPEFKAQARRSLLLRTSEKWPTSLSFELWKKAPEKELRKRSEPPRNTHTYIHKQNPQYTCIYIYRQPRRGYIYIYVYIYISVCVRVCVYVCHNNSCMNAWMHACMHTCIHAYMHTCIHAYMRTCIHAYIHTCILVYLRSRILACVSRYIYIHVYISI